MENAELSIGFETRTYIDSNKKVKLRQFFKDARNFFINATNYIIEKFPFRDDVLKHACVADVNKRQSVKFSSLSFFLNRFPCLLKDGVTADQIEDEFRRYQITELDNAISQKRIDSAWREIGLIKVGEVCIFKNLSCVMLGILVMFHSNADCERVFSLVTKNKTQYRASLSTDMLSSLVTHKVVMSARQEVCHSQQFDDGLLRKAKSATYEALK